VDNLTYLIFALVKFHVFNDGNKRSSIALGTYLLELNGYNITKKFVMEMEIDPRGEWIPEQLRGYRLQGDPEPVYVPITNNQSTELQLQLVVEEKIIAFYRLDDGAKLLPIAFGASEAIEELNIALEEQSAALDRQKELTEQETQRVDRAA
jgi:hypothetical protein